MRRSGLTLVELLVTMALAGLTLALVASISLRQQRVFADLNDQGALANQLHEAAAAMPIDLRALSPQSGDIREARDTALEIRATIASAITCDTTSSGAIVLPPAGGSPGFASFALQLEAGDSLWVLAARADSDAWSPARITSVASVAGRQCAPGGPQLPPDARTAARTVLTVSAAAPPSIGTPVRATRALRVSLYRASDGGWYVGERDWNNTTNKFNIIQPLAGPFNGPSASGGGLGFTYVDASGAAMASPVADPTKIALVRIDLRGQTRAATRVLGAATAAIRHADSITVLVALRNRP